MSGRRGGSCLPAGAPLHGLASAQGFCGFQRCEAESISREERRGHRWGEIAHLYWRIALDSQIEFPWPVSCFTLTTQTRAVTEATMAAHGFIYINLADVLSDDGVYVLTGEAAAKVDAFRAAQQGKES
jgi:hypothetical protein